MTKIKDLTFIEQLRYLEELRALYLMVREAGAEELEDTLVGRIKDILSELPHN